jgi:hypothetical protein
MSSAEYAITASNLDKNYVMGSDAGKLSLSTVYVSSSLNWVPPRAAETQVVMNSTAGNVSFNFPSNYYLTRTFRVTATNVAQGFVSDDVVLNLDTADVVTTVPAMIQAQNVYGTQQGKVYTIKTIDTDVYKTPPPPFYPTIAGATLVTLTWNPPPPAYLTRLFVNWTNITPGGAATSYAQPIVYYTNFGTTPLVIPDTFVVGQTYQFKITCEATSTTLSETLTMTYTPTYIQPVVPGIRQYYTVNEPVGATTLIHSWSANIPNNPSNANYPVVSYLSITWTPSTATPYLINYPVTNGLQSYSLSGFLPGKQYTFTYKFSADNSGVYDSWTTTFGPYNILYLAPTVTFTSPVTSSNVGSMSLGWNFVAPSGGAPVFVQVNPSSPSSLVSTYTTIVPAGTSNLTVGNLTLGVPYDISYEIQPDASGVYGQGEYISAFTSIVVRNNPILTPSNFSASGGTIVTLNWTNAITPAMAGTVAVSLRGQNSVVHTESFTVADSSLVIHGYTFVVGTSYTFTFTFPQSQTNYQAVYQLQYTPAYLPRPPATINAPKAIGSGTSAQLSWVQSSNLISTGHINYYKAASSNISQVPFAINQSNVLVSGLTLGSNYIFNYYFDPDISGIYAGSSNMGYTYTPKGNPYIAPSSITISGGTTVTLSWQLQTNIDGVIQNVNGVNTTITWIPTTDTMGSGQQTTNNTISIPGFEANEATEYWFTFAFDSGQETVAYSTIYPPLNGVGFIPVLMQPQAPVISVNNLLSAPTSASTANITVQWAYNYVAAVNILALNTVTGINTQIRVEPFDQNGNPQNSVTLPEVSNGLPYTFTLVFDPDVSGTVLGTQQSLVYTVPLYPRLTVNIYPYSNSGNTRNVNVFWTASITPYDSSTTVQTTIPLDTTVDIVATPPPPASRISVLGLACSLGTYRLSGLRAGLTYVVDITFHGRQSTPTTWPITIEQEYTAV